jgi:molybdenum cofactor cytidylyltransferase
MKWLSVPPEESLGKILCHNIADEQGHKALHKGALIGTYEMGRLQALGMQEVMVAALEAGDVHENVAAQRLAAACAGEGVELNDASGGRVNLLASRPGLLKVDPEALGAVNRIDGLTIATVRHDAVVAEQKMVATIKIIPFAVSESSLAQAEAICREHGGIISVRAMPPTHVGVILAGSESARERVMKSFDPPIRARVEALGSVVRDVVYVAHQSKAIASAIELLRVAGAGMVIIAGETSIMDIDDVTPRGIVQAGGEIEHYGAPVEPGNLMLLAYLPALDGGPAVPVLGAPGCVRSRDTNVVDLVLPRLLAGEHLVREDILALADGGLMM